MEKNYTAIIIGSGPAGYTAAIRIAQLGGTAAIVERDLIGGICTNWGCTPSKAMITSAKYAKYLKESAKYGINHENMTIDFNTVAERRDKIMEDSRNHIRELLDHHKVDVYHGSGEIIGQHHVKVSYYNNPNWGLTKANGESPYEEASDKNTIRPENETAIEIEAENIILATGSEPLLPPFLQKTDASIVNSNKLIWIKDLPKEITIIGGGIIGLEFSALFSHFGTKIRIIEFLDRVLAGMDPEISAEITKQLNGLGVEILTGHKVLDITNGKVKAEVIATGETIEINSAMNLIAIGRKAVLHNEMLEKAGIEYTPKGIKVNEYLQTNLPNVYAVGDATGLSILAHVAIQQGIFAAENIMSETGKCEKKTMDYSVVPAVVYTLPEVATVGSVPADLTNIKVVKFPFSANLRASIEEHTTGFVKMWIDELSGTLIATQLIGEYAGEIVQAYANLIALKTTLEDVSRIIHAHPTYSEVVRNSIEFALGRAIEWM